MKTLLSFVLSLSISLCVAQNQAGFESFNLPAESFLNGDDGSGGFSDENIFLSNDFNTDFQSWSGWAISNTTDTTTPGFGNQYSCIAGQGYESMTYATTFVLGESKIIIDRSLGAPYFQDLRVNNATYAFLSMLEGDAFAKKFGGETGDDPDFFLLTIKAYEDGILSSDSIDFYLADYRFEDNSKDYIIKDWKMIDLTTFATADSLSLTLSSSDVGAFGMNTPAYFCIDDIRTSIDLPTSNDNPLFNASVFPNPTSEYLNIELGSLSSKERNVLLYNEMGQLVHQTKLENNNSAINVSHLNSGIYWGFIQDDDEKIKFSFVKK